MYTCDMRRNKHNIHTQYRTTLFGYRMIMIREKIVITKHFVIDLYREKNRKIKRYKKQKTRGKKIVSQVDCLHGIE